MLIGISNLSWSNEENDKYIPVISESGYDYVESAYSKIFEGYKILSIQSIFYKSGIQSFKQKTESVKHIQGVIDLCSERGIEKIVLGSPTMRTGSYKNLLSVLDEVDEYLKDKNVRLCLEPNSSEYGAEYFTTLQSISEYILSYRNISSMIDVGNSLLENQNPLDEFEKFNEIVSHIHFSSPHLNPIKDFSLYKHFFNYLNEKGYNGLLTYEFIDNKDLIRTIYEFKENLKNE
jgi:sugar phosphate isomerase/epimerase